MKTSFTCIIPFFNEGKQLLTIIEAVSKVSLINQIIVVDDGSTNKMSETVEDKFGSVTLIKLPLNSGKTEAVKAGLEKAKNDQIVMLDADYQNVNSSEIGNVLTRYENLKLDMLLLQVKGGNNLLDKLLRKEILFTGFRILGKSNLAEVLKTNPKGYQLEVAINEYMIINKKSVGWLPTGVLNVHKSQKWGFFAGFVKSFKMELSILAYLGLLRFSKQVYSFARNKVK